MRIKRPNKGKRRKLHSRITKPGTPKAPKAPAFKAPEGLKTTRRADKWERLAKRNAEMYAMAVAIAADSTLQDVSSSASSQTEAVPNEAKATTTNMPPRMARKKQVAADRIDEISKNPARAKKELARLNALISKLTESTDHVKPKVLYLDEKQLAARWGMSVKHVRNLRAAGVGPRVTYFGRSVRYRLRDVVAFEKANAFASRTDKEQSD